MGTPEEVYDAYRGAMRVETERRASSLQVAPRRTRAGLEISRNRFGTLEVEIANVRIDPVRVERAPTDPPVALRIDIDLEPRVDVEDPIVGVSLRRQADGG